MTTDALRRLQVEADRLPWLQAVAALRAPVASTVLAAGDRHLAASRLERLRRVLNEGYVVKPDGQAVIGSRVTVRHADGEQELYELVAPGEAAVRQGRISTDAPLGASMGSCAVRRSRTRKRAAVGGGVDRDRRPVADA